ncbi:hypothetical protein KSP39_PZI008469 [Platanthera zijinensis]|uniref:Uncharacterized protein n=1 Tax=Platanthera zijinensis TaxID=2320716 RepID=A0AAP0G8K7_9ASPA
MDEKLGLARFGGCMKVDNVQALAALLSADIPQRYVRPEREEDIIVFNGDEDKDSGGDDIPVVDFGRLLAPQFSKDEAARLHLACKEWGFF